MTDTTRFKRLLEDELATLEGELRTVGVLNPNNPADWVPKGPKVENLEPDRNDAADNIEQYEENSGILKELEIRYNNVKRALKKIADAVYGTCEIGGESIEADRLEANPAARTCKVHLEEEEDLPM